MIMTSRTESPEVEALKAEFNKLRAEVAMLVESMKKDQHSAAESSNNPGTDETETDTSQWEDFKAKIERARNQTETIQRELSEEVRKHPITSIAVFFGIGYLISKIIK